MSKITINENNFPLWANKNLKNLIINKKYAHKKYKISGLHSDYLIFLNLRKQCKQLISLTYSQFMANFEDNIQTNIKFFWKFVNSLKKKNTNITDIVSYNEILSSNDKEKVQFFANYLFTVYVESTNLNATTSTLFSNNNLNLQE